MQWPRLADASLARDGQETGAQGDSGDPADPAATETDTDPPRERVVDPEAPGAGLFGDGNAPTPSPSGCGLAGAKLGNGYTLRQVDSTGRTLALRFDAGTFAMVTCSCEVDHDFDCPELPTTYDLSAYGVSGVVETKVAHHGTFVEPMGTFSGSPHTFSSSHGWTSRAPSAERARLRRRSVGLPPSMAVASRRCPAPVWSAPPRGASTTRRATPRRQAGAPDTPGCQRSPSATTTPMITTATPSPTNISVRFSCSFSAASVR